MKTDFKLLFMVLLVGSLVPILVFGIDYYAHEQAIQFHDAYFVFNPFEFALVPIGLILFVVFLLRAVKTKFRNRWAILFLVSGGILTAASA